MLHIFLFDCLDFCCILELKRVPVYSLLNTFYKTPLTNKVSPSIQDVLQSGRFLAKKHSAEAFHATPTAKYGQIRLEDEDLFIDNYVI